MSITNTITVSNDSEILDKIVSKTITELLDDRVLNVRAYCFYQCESLKTINFPNATSFGNYAFYGCSALEKLDAPLLEAIPYYGFVDCASLKEVNFPNATTSNQYAFLRCTSLKKADFGKLSLIHNGMFSGATSLDTLVLRNEEQVCTNNYSDSLMNTPIANGTGYVYVPRSLVDAYKADAKWSVYANQIRAIEDYPGVCNPYTWEGVFINIDNGTYKDVYKVGDLVPLDLGTLGAVNMEIVGFDVDTLPDESGKAPISWISKEVPKENIQFNPGLASTTDDSGNTVYTEGTGTIGGWEKSAIRSYIGTTLKAKMPEKVLNRIVPVVKTQPAYSTQGASVTQTTIDDLWIPSRSELEGLYLSAFNSSEKRTKYYAGTTTVKGWWQRSAYNNKRVHTILSAGVKSYDDTDMGMCIALGFCT